MPEQKFLTNIELDGDLIDINGNSGTSGQVLSSLGSGNGVDWIDIASDTAERIEVTVKNISGGSLSKGTVVHASPSANPPGGNVIEVIAADYDDSTKMPAIGILNETIANEVEGSAVMMGAVSGINTSSFSVGDELYVGNLGTLTNTKPATAGQLIQKIAVVIKSHASNGLIKIFGAGRSNDVPLPLYIDNTNQRVGISDPAPAEKLVVREARSGTGASAQTKYTLVSKSTIYSGTPGTGGIKVVYDDGTNEHGFGLVSGSSSADFLTTGPMHFYTDSDLNTQSATGFAMVIDNNQRLGIGLTNPSTKLEVAGTDGNFQTTGHQIFLTKNGVNQIYTNSGASPDVSQLAFGTNNTERMRISSTGNVGIGTASPIHKLQVGDGTGSKSLAVSSGTESSLYLTTPNSTAQSVIGFGNSQFATINTRGRILYQSSTTPASNYMQFNVAFNEIMRLTDSNVGIGTTSPTQKLEVVGATKLHGNLIFDDSYNVVGGDVLELQTGGSTKIVLNSSDNGVLIDNGSGGLVSDTFKSNFDDNIFTGNVGINVTSPQARLHVDAPSVKAASLTFGAQAGQIFQNENSEFAFGLHNVSPYPLYIQGRTHTNGARQIALNPLGGNIGIGTTSPLTNLHVSSGTSGDATVIIEADTDNNQENDLPRLWFKADGGITEGAIQLSDNQLDIINNVSTGGGIVFKTGTTNNYNTTDPDNGAAERMIIKSDGNVETYGTYIRSQYDGTHYAQIENNSSGGVLKAVDGGATTVMFRSYGDSYVTNDFGLGVTSPDEKLHVNGNTRITSRLYNTQHSSPSLTSGQWYRIVEITGSSGRGKCEFSIGGSGGSGTPSLIKATVNTAWANSNSTIKVDFNSKSSAFSEFRVVRNATSNKSFVDVKVSGGEDSVLLQVYPIAWDSAYAVDFTNVTTLPSGDSVETSVPLTNTAFALANNNGSDVDPVFKVDHDSKVHAEEFIGQRVIVNGNAYHGTANSVFQLYSTAVGMTTSTSNSMHHPYTAIIMPFNGVVEKVIIKNVKYSSYSSGPSASGTARIQLKQYDSTYAPMDYSSGNVSFTAAANVSMTFSPNQSYSEGTHFRVFWNSSAIWRYVTYQIVLKQTS